MNEGGASDTSPGGGRQAGKVTKYISRLLTMEFQNPKYSARKKEGGVGRNLLPPSESTQIAY